MDTRAALRALVASVVGALVLPIPALAQISTEPPNAMPVDNPLALAVLAAAFVAAAWLVLRRRQHRAALMSVLCVGLVAGVLWQSPQLRAQLLFSFTNPAGETLTIPATQILDSGDIAGFEMADYTNDSGVRLSISALIPPDFDDCFPGGSAVNLQSPGSPDPTPPPACTLGQVLTNGATCRVNVDAVCRAAADETNEAPTASDDAYVTDEDVELTVPAPGVLDNDNDNDGDTLTAVLDTDVANGTLTLNADGSFTYNPNADFNGTDNFTYHATDGTADSATVTVTITVDPLNDGPNAVDDIFATGEDSVLNEVAPGVLANDTDPENDPLTVTGFDATSAQGATVNVNADGSFSYDPTGAAVLQALDDGESLEDTFTYTIDDGSGNPDTATVTVEVSGANDAPVGADDGYETDEDVELNVPAPGVLVNDTDVELEPLTAVLVSGPANANSFILNFNGSFTYTPALNFSGSDSFTYRANDGTANSNLATVTITVNPVNDPPVAGAD